MARKSKGANKQRQPNRAQRRSALVPVGRIPAQPMQLPSRKRLVFLAIFRWDIRFRSFVNSWSRPGGKELESNSFIAWFRRIVGIGIVVGGWELMAISYMVGLSLVYFGFFVCVAECLFDPVFSKSPYLRAVGVIGVIILAGLFSFKVAFVSAPIESDAYAMRHGENPPGNVIAGITWNTHFTDLRVWINNRTNKDYKELYLSIQPDRWNYKAAIASEDTGCQLSPLMGSALLDVPSATGGASKITAHREGDAFEAADDSGDVFQHFVSQGGYRLICTRFPAHASIQIVFALVSIDEKYASQIFPKTPPKDSTPGGWGFSAAAGLSGVKNGFDLLAARPSTDLVKLDGHYDFGLKTYSISRNVKVGDGN